MTETELERQWRSFWQFLARWEDEARSLVDAVFVVLEDGCQQSMAVVAGKIGIDALGIHANVIGDER